MRVRASYSEWRYGDLKCRVAMTRRPTAWGILKEGVFSAATRNQCDEDEPVGSSTCKALNVRSILYVLSMYVCMFVMMMMILRRLPEIRMDPSLRLHSEALALL